MTISGGCAGGFPAARHYPAAALVQLSIWPHLKYRAHYGTANLGAFFNKPRHNPASVYQPQPMQPRECLGWDSLWARVGWKVIRVILLRGNKYLRLRKARIGQSSNVGRKGLPWQLILQLFPEWVFSDRAWGPRGFVILSVKCQFGNTLLIWA